MGIRAREHQRARAGLGQADEAEAGRAVGEDTRVGDVRVVREGRGGGRVGDLIIDGRTVRALGDLSEGLGLAVQVEFRGAVEAEDDFRRVQNRIVLTEAENALGHGDTRVSRTRPSRVEDHQALTEGRLGATSDEVAGDRHRTRRVGPRIVVTRDVITTGLDAVIKRDAARQSYDCIWRGQLDGSGPVDVTTREPVKDEVIRDGDAVGQLETSVAVGVGTCRRSDCNRAGRQTQGILHLDVARRDEEVTRHIVVDGGIKDQATRTNLREVSRAREDARGGISRGGPNIERHFTSQGDDGARPDRTIGRGRQGGARLERNRPRQGIRRDPHADF